MTKDDVKSIAVKIADELNIQHEWVLAICRAESAFDHLAVRFEPGWKYEFKIAEFATLLNISYATERNLQMCSWGPMQIMGTVAREFGFKESILKLTEPELGIRYGCLKLKSLINKYGYSDNAISSYNAGSPTRATNGQYKNQAYVDKVKKFLEA